jgi:hypothetical protein
MPGLQRNGLCHAAHVVQVAPSLRLVHLRLHAVPGCWARKACSPPTATSASRRGRRRRLAPNPQLGGRLATSRCEKLRPSGLSIRMTSSGQNPVYSLKITKS